MSGRCEIGILTVARCLREGVGADVRCFVSTKSGLREVEGFTGQPGAMHAVLMYHPRRNLAQLPVPVLLDTEVFLAKRDLTGMDREEVLKVAEKAASADALIRPQRSIDLASEIALDVARSLADAPKTIEESSGVEVQATMWQG